MRASLPRTGVPKLWAMASFERESSSRLSHVAGAGRSLGRGFDPRAARASAVPQSGRLRDRRLSHRSSRPGRRRQLSWPAAVSKANSSMASARGCMAVIPAICGRLVEHLHRRQEHRRWRMERRRHRSAVRHDPVDGGAAALLSELALADRAPPALVRPSPLAASPPLVPDPPHRRRPRRALAAATPRRSSAPSPPIAVDGSYGRETRRAVAAFQDPAQALS